MHYYLKIVILFRVGSSERTDPFCEMRGHPQDLGDKLAAGMDDAGSTSGIFDDFLDGCDAIVD